MEATTETTKAPTRMRITWEPWLSEWVPWQQGGDLFVDVGANEGAYSKLLARVFRKVVALEPNPEALELLGRVKPDNVAIVPLGAWDKPGVLRFQRFKHHSHMSAIFEDQGIDTGPSLGEMELECTTVDTVLADHPGRVDFLKVDTEGAEIQVLRGAAATLERDRPQVLIEIHERQNWGVVETILGALGYEPKRILHPFYNRSDPNRERHGWIVAPRPAERVTA